MTCVFEADTRLRRVVAVGLLGLFVASASAAPADDAGRAGKIELFATGQWMDGDSSDLEDSDAELSLDDRLQGGIGAGYNITDRLNVNTLVYIGSVDVSATEPDTDTRRGESDLLGWDVNAEYNIIDWDLTSIVSLSPVVTAGVGLIAFDAKPGTIKLDETDLTYNLGLGARAEFGRNTFVKALYKSTWANLEDTEDSLRLDGLTLQIGQMF